jgi:Concanavalin A-like lectin/glucanases superfamily
MSGSSPEPQPWSVQSAAGYMAAMRRLKAWSGLSYRQLAKRASALGDYLPHSTTAAVLGRDTLPREDVVAAFVRACGCEAETVDAWLAVRKRLLAADPASAGPDAREEVEDGTPSGPRPGSGETTRSLRPPFGRKGAEAAAPPEGRPVERPAADEPTRPLAGSRGRRLLLWGTACAATAGLVLTLVVTVTRSGSDGPPVSRSHSPSTPVAASGPVARWRFGRRTGTSVADSSGHGVLLKLSGRSSRVPAPGGPALKLNGAGYASTERPVIRTDEPFTVTAWVRLDSASDWSTVVSQHGQSYDVFLLNYHKEADRWAFMAPDQAGGAPMSVALSTAPPRLRVWTHLGAVYDGDGGLHLYVGGRLGGSATGPPLRRATGVMDIGRALYQGTEVDRLRGAVGEVSVYARALSAEELRDAATAAPRGG